MMFTTHTEWTKFWVNIWVDCADDPGEVGEIEGVIFQKKNGDWVMAVLAPNSNMPMVVKVDFNPWTGEKLPELK